MAAITNPILSVAYNKSMYLVLLLHEGRRSASGLSGAFSILDHGSHYLGHGFIAEGQKLKGFSRCKKEIPRSLLEMSTLLLLSVGQRSHMTKAKVIRAVERIPPPGKQCAVTWGGAWVSNPSTGRKQRVDNYACLPLANKKIYARLFIAA